MLSCRSRTLVDYLSLNYPIVLHADPDGGYVAEIKDLPGCLTQGETIKETLKTLIKRESYGWKQYLN
jgi:hypothetical protein